MIILSVFLTMYELDKKKPSREAIFKERRKEKKNNSPPNKQRYIQYIYWNLVDLLLSSADSIIVVLNFVLFNDTNRTCRFTYYQLDVKRFKH